MSEQRMRIDAVSAEAFRRALRTIKPHLLEPGAQPERVQPPPFPPAPEGDDTPIVLPPWVEPDAECECGGPPGHVRGGVYCRRPAQEERKGGDA